MFEITEEEQKKINEWYKTIVKPKALELQRKAQEEDSTYASVCGDKEVYYGAIGGGLTYEFTPTSLGTVFRVKEAITGLELDLTDYDSW